MRRRVMGGGKIDYDKYPNGVYILHVNGKLYTRAEWTNITISLGKITSAARRPLLSSHSTAMGRCQFMLESVLTVGRPAGISTRLSSGSDRLLGSLWAPA